MKVLRRHNWLHFLFARRLVGLSKNAYIVARAFSMALTAVCLIAIIADRRLLTHWSVLVLAAFTAVIVTLPQLSLHSQVLLQDAVRVP